MYDDQTKFQFNLPDAAVTLKCIKVNESGIQLHSSKEDIIMQSLNSHSNNL